MPEAPITEATGSSVVILEQEKEGERKGKNDGDKWKPGDDHELTVRIRNVDIGMYSPFIGATAETLNDEGAPRRL